MSAQSQRKVFIVTGGASGIGLGITRYLISQQHPNLSPAHIAIFDINTETGSGIVTSLQQEKGLPASDSTRTATSTATVSFHQCDVSSWESQLAAFKEVVTQYGRIYYVFANAGISERGSLLQNDLGDDGNGEPVKPVLTTLNVNLIGVIYSVKLAIHYIRKNEINQSGSSSSGAIAPVIKGGIICTASNAGLYPFPVAPIYATTKHGVVGLVRSLARPLALERIQINGLAPAVVETNIAPSSELFKSMVITPMSTVTRAVDTLLTSSNSGIANSVMPEANLGLFTGKIAELHEGIVTFAEQPAYVDENTAKNIEMFWSLGYS